VLVIHHGLADHGARYGDLARRLVDAGYAVWALDMRGHGRSAGPRVSSPSIDAYLDDLDRGWRWCGPPSRDARCSSSVTAWAA
jgi:acylglycerol lipase